MFSQLTISVCVISLINFGSAYVLLMFFCMWVSHVILSLSCSIKILSLVLAHLIIQQILILLTFLLVFVCLYLLVKSIFYSFNIEIGKSQLKVSNNTWHKNRRSRINESRSPILIAQRDEHFGFVFRRGRESGIVYLYTCTETCP